MQLLGERIGCLRRGELPEMLTGFVVVRDCFLVGVMCSVKDRGDQDLCSILLEGDRLLGADRAIVVSDNGPVIKVDVAGLYKAIRRLGVEALNHLGWRQRREAQATTDRLPDLLRVFLRRHPKALRSTLEE